MILKNNKRIDGCSDTVPIGTLNPFLGSTAPYGYLICQGQKVSKTTYKELYDICGDTFGQSTDTEFYLPDLRGQTIAGYKEGDSTFGTLGGLIGSLTHLHSTGNHTLTVEEIPSHNHRTCISHGGPGGGANVFDLAITGVTNSPQWSASTYQYNAGGGQAHNHGDTSSTSSIQPTIVLNWIVKAFQLMPNQSYVSSVKQNSDVNTYSCNYINDNIDNSYIDVFEGDFNSLVATSANKVTNYCIKTDSLNNKPCPYWGWLTSYFMSDETMKQIFISDVNTMYTRQKLNGNWMPWRSIGEDIYSTEEQVIGTWINSKPIYRKTFTISGSPTFTNNKHSFKHNIANFGICVKLYGVLYDPVNKAYFNLPYVGRGSADIMLYSTSSLIYLEQQPYGNNRLKDVYITIEYTKTTD